MPQSSAIRPFSNQASRVWPRNFGRPGCALNRPTWSPVRGSSA